MKFKPGGSVQPMKYIQDIKATHTCDIVLEIRKFWEIPTSELEGCWVFWSWNGWGNESINVRGFISAYIYSLKLEWEKYDWIGKEISDDMSETSKKWLVLGGNIDELTGVSSKEGMEASDSDISEGK